MKIAILGWGSLIWDKRDLKIKETISGNEWKQDGPELPLEFSRVSLDGRLTLVIDNQGTVNPVLYAISEFADIQEAKNNLTNREGTSKSNIGCMFRNGTCHPADFIYTTRLLNWLKANPDIDALIWTNLQSNFELKTGKQFSPANALQYLHSLEDHKKITVVNYILKAPLQIHTIFRTAFEKELITDI